jgi:hypothetical protein
MPFSDQSDQQFHILTDIRSGPVFVIRPGTENVVARYGFTPAWKTPLIAPSSWEAFETESNKKYDRNEGWPKVVAMIEEQ